MKNECLSGNLGSTFFEEMRGQCERVIKKGEPTKRHSLSLYKQTNADWKQAVLGRVAFLADKPAANYSSGCRE